VNPVRLALVGTGRWAKNYISAAKEAEIVQTLSARGFAPERVRADVEAVVYAGHPCGAAAACEAALSLELPILCEKPAGLSLADAERILAAERASKAFVLVGHQHLFAEGYEEFRVVAKDSDEVHATWEGPGPERDFSAWWDYGPHAVSAALGVLGGTATADYFPPSWSDDDDFFVLRSDGRKCYVNAGNKAEKKQARIYVSADKNAGTEVAYDAYASSAEPPLTSQVRAFARAVRNGGTDDYRFGAKWAVDVARVLEAAQ
jgi:predicted dehydrogenase